MIMRQWETFRKPVANKGGNSNPTHTRRIAAGLCRRCGAPRQPDGTAYHCRHCADKVAAYARAGGRKR